MREWIVHTLGGGATAVAIVVAIIGLAGALGGALTSYIIAQKTVYINAITTERMKWISSLKMNLASMIGILNSVEAHIKSGGISTNDELKQDFRKLNEISSLLEMQLNPRGEIEKNIMILLEGVQRNLSIKGLDDASLITKSLCGHARWMFKIEWHQVKMEASGSIRSVKLFFSRRMLLKSYQDFASVDPGLVAARGKSDIAT